MVYTDGGILAPYLFFNKTQFVYSRNRNNRVSASQLVSIDEPLNTALRQSLLLTEADLELAIFHDSATQCWNHSICH